VASGQAWPETEGVTDLPDRNSSILSAWGYSTTSYSPVKMICGWPQFLAGSGLLFASRLK